MPTSPSPITALPTPPSSTDPANFDARGDALLGALPALVTETNAAGTVTYANAVEAAASATAAAAARDAAIVVADAAMWAAGTNYATGTAAISPITYKTYIRKSPGGVNATDPSASALWEPQTLTRVTSGVLEHWDGTQWVPQGWRELGVQATTSGTSVTFSSIPTWVNELALRFEGVSLSVNDDIRVRLGTSGGVVTTGYLGVSQYVNMLNATTGATRTTGIFLETGASVVISGDIGLRRRGNIWTFQGALADHGGSGVCSASGQISLAAALTQVEIAAQSGAFDLGAVALIGRA
jgi:hypothetical protein